MKYASCATLSLLFAAATLVAADEDVVEQKGEVTYTIPAGWDREEREAIVVLTPKDLSPDECAIVVTPGETLPQNGNFNKWFKDKWEALRKGRKIVQGGQRSGKEGPNGSSVLFEAALLDSTTDAMPGRMGLLLYAVHIGNAVHWVVFKADGAELFNQHKKTANAFLAALKFSETKVEVKAKAKPADEPRSNRAQPSQVLKARPK